MAFVREKHHACLYPPQPCGLESLHGLVGRYAKILFALHDQDRGIPFVDIGRRGEFVVRRVAPVLPIGAAEVFVGKKYLFGRAVPALHVERSAMGDESLETAFVLAGQHIHGIAAVRGADCA